MTFMNVLLGHKEKYVRTSRKLVCMRVSHVPLSSPWRNALTTGKYEYGNVAQSECLWDCVCVCAGFWTDRWFLSAPVVCRNQGGMSVHSMGGKNTLFFTHTHSLCGIMTARKNLPHAPFWQQSKVC